MQLHEIQNLPKTETLKDFQLFCLFPAPYYVDFKNEIDLRTYSLIY